MKLSFDKDIEEFLKNIAKNALETKTRAFFVGGFVRDTVLGVKTSDIDILIQGSAIEFVDTLGYEVASYHFDFCSAKVRFNDTLIDFASTRTEAYPYPGCLPVIKEVGVELEQDVLRRDFTINSIYLEIKLIDNELNFELIDFTGGIEDIKNKTLKVLHNKSYIDDPTRILRGLEFKHRFNFDFSFEDKKMINNCLSTICLDKNASWDRIFAVYKRILSKNNSFQIFKELVDKKCYKLLFDEDIEIDYSKIIEAFKLIHLNNEQKVCFYLDIFKNQEVAKLNFDRLYQIINTFAKFSINELLYYYYKTNDDNVLFYLNNKDVKICLNGSILLDLGYKQGKIIGQILNSVFEFKLKNPKKSYTLADEIEFVKKNFT